MPNLIKKKHYLLLRLLEYGLIYRQDWLKNQIC